MMRQWILNRETARATTPTGAASTAAQTLRFRNRGTEVTRLEGFSDAVFGFAITLLVVSLQPPNTFADLITDLQRLPAFAASFAIIVMIWSIHYSFFRRYGLQDITTIILNMALLFVVLFYVYPLRFVFEISFDASFGFANTDKLIDTQDTTALYVIYATGFIAVFGALLLMYVRAYQLRTALDLTPLERYDTITALWINGGLCIVGVVSAALALGHIGLSWAAPGLAYFLITPLQFIARGMRGRGRRSLEAKTLQQADELAPVQAVGVAQAE